MQSRTKHVYGNWKMNLTSKEIHSFAENIKNQELNEKVEIGFFPSLTYISALKELLPEVKIGAQNFYPADKGAYTGETSILQVKDVGARMALVGHSERRVLFHEDHGFLKQKVDAALNAGLEPVFCCGEPFDVRKASFEKEFVHKQLEDSLFHLPKEQLMRCVIAYEPIWAIGTGLTASVDQAEEMHAFIRNSIEDKYDANTSKHIVLLYGGSCNASNASELFSCPNVDGGLIGGASLNVDAFMSIVNSF
jgi:triosephosphate isomerase